jgi:hypothetical protein
MLREAYSKTCRKGGFKDSSQEDSDGGGLGLRKIGGVSKFSVQVPSKKIMSQGGKKGCARSTAFFPL